MHCHRNSEDVDYNVRDNGPVIFVIVYVILRRCPPTDNVVRQWTTSHDNDGRRLRRTMSSIDDDDGPAVDIHFPCFHCRKTTKDDGDIVNGPGCRCLVCCPRRHRLSTSTVTTGRSSSSVVAFVINSSRRPSSSTDCRTTTTPSSCLVQCSLGNAEILLRVNMRNVPHQQFREWHVFEIPYSVFRIIQRRWWRSSPHNLLTLTLTLKFST